MFIKVRIISAFLALSMLLSFVRPVDAATSDEIRTEIDSLEQDKTEIEEYIKELESLLEGNQTEIRQIVAEKNIIDRQVTAMRAKIAATEKQIRAYSIQIAEQQEKVDEAIQEYNRLVEASRVRIRAMEEHGSLSYWSVIFKATSFRNFLDRLFMIREIYMADRLRIEYLNSTAKTVSNEKELLESKLVILSAYQRELENSKTQCDKKQAESEELLTKLLNKGMEFEDLLDHGERELALLMEQIANKEAEFDEAEYQEWLAAQTPKEPEGRPAPPSNDGWITPVSNYVLSSPFGMRLHPILGIYRMHDGIDMGCPQGTPIYAARGGQITIAQWSDSAGNYVQINHGDGFRSVYMHMVEYVVSAGDYVAPGQLIGFVGNTGLSKGAHLHFGISYNGEYINPLEFIS